jgi:Tol biopolymer transport system component
MTRIEAMKRPSLAALALAFGLAGAVALIAALAHPPVAHSAFPGRNGKIAFTEPVGVGPESVFTMRPDGSAKRQVAPRGHDPAFSPTGKKIAFERHGNIWTTAATGSHPKRLTRGPARDSVPSFSPSGKRLVFVRFVPEKISTLYTIRADGSHARRLTDSRNMGLIGSYPNPQFSPNGRWIVFSSGCRILIIRARASHPHSRPLTNGECTGFREVTPDFSPNGNRIAYARISDDPLVGIWVMRLDGSDQTQITVGNDRQPAFSPNGRRIAFSGKHRGDALGRAIYTMRTDGSGVTPHLTRGNGIADAPSWGVRPQ